MPSASDNNGVYPYPQVHDVTYPNPPAPEATLPERTGDPYIGGSLPDEPRVKGLQPGFDYPGVPLSGMG